MSENGGGRPRRSTRYSSNALTSSASASSSSTSAIGTGNAGPSTPNPYKKPTYLANRASETTPVSSGRGRGRGRGRPSAGRGGGSSTRGGGRDRNSRPECVATRVESRRSTGGSSTTGSSSAAASAAKKKKRGYNSQDFHYGSDFESDRGESDREEVERPSDDSDSGSADDNGRYDGGDSDSDDLFSVISSTKVLRLPSPPVPVWLEAEKIIDDLELPKSSDDLLLDRDLVMKAVAIYEPLRRFHQLVRLSPFRFEDFCAALGSDEQSSLLAEIHIQLLKTILREEDANGTMFGPNEIKDSVQAVLYFVDNLTWPESLRSFLESDPDWAEILDEINSVEYPFCGPEIRIRVLSWLVDMFLATNSVREGLLSEGNILHEDHCRSCNRLGELICCETCPAVYHLACIVPALKDDEDPPDDWKCPVCIKHTLSGIIDCASELEKAGLLIRHEKLGYDRHGRKYWFLVRRILVESDDGSSVWYYSTPLQVEELMYRLDEELYEADLVDNIRTFKDEIIRQMEITERITSGLNNHRKTYIDAENAFLKRIHEEREEAMKLETEQKSAKEEEAREAKRIEDEKKALVEEEARQKEEAERKRIREERLRRRNRNKFVDYDDNIPMDVSSDDQKDLDTSDSNTATNHCDQLLEDDEEIEAKNSKNDEKDQVKPEGETPTDEEPEVAEEKPTESKEDAVVKDNSEEDTQVITESQLPTQLLDEEPKKEAETVKKEDPDSPKEVKMDTTDDASEKEPEVVKVEPSSVEEDDSKPKNERRRKSKALLLDWDTDERMTRLKATGLYKLGQEGNFRNYVNSYSNDSLALGKSQHVEDRDRRRHMSHKFSLTLASECKWSGSQNGFRSSIVSTLRTTLLHLEGAFPTTLMHVNWPMLRKAWVSAVSACVNSKDFSKAMVALAACIRPACYNPVWSESLGHFKLMRMSALDREERKKAEKRDKKDRDEEEDRLRILPQLVKYTIPIKHQIYKQKGEEYRIHGRWGWIWLSNLRRCKSQDCRKMGLLGGPFKHVIQVKNEIGKVKTILIDPSVFDKLMAKRNLSQKTTSSTTPSASPMKGNESPDMTSDTPTKQDKDDSTKEKDAAADRLDSIDEKPEVEELPSETKSEETTAVEEEKDLKKPEVSESEPMEVVEDDKEKADKDKEEDTKQDEGEKPQTSTVDEIKVEVKEEAIDIDEKKVEDEVTIEEKSEEKSQEVLEVEKEVEEIPSEKSKEVAKEKEEVVEEKDEKPLTSTSSDEIPKNAVSGVGRKFKTDLVNVSLGIVSANRILYPKIAHRAVQLDSLLARRMKLQVMEEKELLDTYGEEMLEKAKLDGVETKELDEATGAEEDENFPLSGIYRYQCYSFVCQLATEEFNGGSGKKRVRTYECKCYSPMCRLKYFVQETQRKKDDKLKEAEKLRMDKIMKEIKEKRMYTQGDLAAKVYLKKLPEQCKKKRNQVKYPPTSTFRSAVSKKPSILILPQHELRKLGRAGGRTFTPSEFAANPKTGSWAWPYPCGRPFFKTGWQYKAVHAPTLAAAAMQLRILWASVRWDDIQMKVPNSDGRNQMTTDMEVITTEILKQRIVGRFMEKVQYLRKKTVVPIDAAPKTIRAKSRESTEITPSRSGLRKRKRAESPDKTDPVVTEGWVDEDKVELWEIKYFGEKSDKKPEPAKSTTPATRTKSGVTLKVPDKYDPSPIQSDKPEKGEKTVSATKSAEMMREQLETELKMQRAVHLSKRDNHPKTSNSVVKTPTPTASQQLQQQNAAAGLPANPRSYSSVGGTPTGTKKIFVTKTATPSSAATLGPGADPVILNRKVPTPVVKPNVTPISTPPQQQQQPVANQTQKITVYRTTDGKLQVRGLLPGQQVYQTPDGRICLSGTPVRTQAQPQQQQAQIMHQSVQTQGQTIVIQGQPGQLQQTGTPGIIQVQGNPNPMVLTSSVATSTPTQVANQPLINISNPAMRTVITSSAASNNPNYIKIQGQGGQQQIVTQQQQQQSPQQQQQQPQLLHTYATPKNSRKANLKATTTPAVSTIINSPTAIAPAGSISGTINAQGQIVLTSSRGTHVIQSAQMNQQGQIVITSQPQGNVVTSSAASSPISVVATSTAAASAQQASSIVVQQQQPVTSQQGGIQIPGIPSGTKTIVVAGGGNLTPQQLQHILQMQGKKFQTIKTSQGVVQQVQVQQQQPQQQSLQLIQQPGQPMQIISQQGAGGLQQLLNNAQLQGQQIVIQTNSAGGHQLATIGGQQVLVKKMIKSSPTKQGGGNVVVAGNQAQLQQLLAQGKNVIRFDQKPQIQQQQQRIQPVMGATTVTRAPGLPISIVSPSKSKMVIQQQQQQQQQQAGTSIMSVVSSSMGIRQIAPGSVIQTIATQQQGQIGVRPPVATLGGSGTQVVSALPGPQVVSAISGTQFAPQHQQQIRVQSPMISGAQMIQGGKVYGPGQIVVSSNQNSQQQFSMQQQQQQQSGGEDVTTPTQQQAPKSPVKGSPITSKIVAHVVQTPQGPKVVLSGLKPGELSPAQWTSLQAQLQKQMLDQHLAQQKGGVQSSGPPVPIKVVLQAPANTNTSVASPVHSPTTQAAPSVIMHQSPEPVGVITSTSSSSSGGPSPAKMARIGADLSPPILGVKSQPVLIKQQGISSASTMTFIGAGSPPHTTTSPVATAAATSHHGHHTIKTPPNSANIDAAIAAVASNVDAPVIVPNRTTPVKKNSPVSHHQQPGGNKKGKSTILKDILQKPEEEGGIFGNKSTPTTPAGNKKKKKAPAKKQQQQPKAGLLMPVEPSSVPQPIEQDVVVSTTEEEVHTSQPVSDVPRFVLSQDLMNQSMEKEAIIPSETSTITLMMGDEKSVKMVATSSSSSPRPTSQPSLQKAPPVATTAKSGSSRRKSPVKSVKSFAAVETHHQNTQSHQQKGSGVMKNNSISPMSHPKLITSLHKHKELLKKDICKKRGLLEKDLSRDIQKEISEELGKDVSKRPCGGNKMDGHHHVSAAVDSHQARPGQKRKSSESKGATHEPEMKSKKGHASPASAAAATPGGRASSPKKKDRKTKLYCVCLTPYDTTKFYVGCDICSNWFHGDCIGISEKMSQLISEYICDACQTKPQGQVYCLCKQPYDDSQFYICCDTCQDWFHGKCVGILQAEGSSIDEYLCPNCDPHSALNHANLKTLTDQDYPALNKLLKDIQRQKTAWPFLEPVDPAEAPNYYKVIKEPMDLQTIQFRVDEKVYGQLAGFIGDITKIFDNCRYYNPAESTFYKCAETLETFFAQKVSLIRQSMSRK